MRKTISIIIPAYNEGRNIIKIAHSVIAVLTENNHTYEIIFIDDGSTDNTSEQIRQLIAENSHIFYLQFSRNHGHQTALKAGIDHARGDCIISMDCDMQHPPALIPTLLAKWEEGFDIVYTVRHADKRLPLSKRVSSNLFYKLMNNVSEVHLEAGVADFRLIDRKVADILKNFRENDLFLRGLINWIGFKQTAVVYQPEQRWDGESKYTIKKMARLALHGVMSFSTRPLYIAIYLGIIFSVLSLLYVPYVLYSLYEGTEVRGWASLIMTIVFFGGLQLLVLGIIGIYIGKIFVQSKSRPNYIISSTNIIND